MRKITYMLCLFFLCSLVYINLHAMNQCDKNQNFGSLNKFVKYETQRNEAITRSEQKILRHELLRLKLHGLREIEEIMPHDIDQFAARYIKYDVAPAAHTKPIGIIQRRIERFDEKIQKAILNSNRFPKLKPYLLLTALGDARTELLTTQFFNGDRSAALIFEKYPCIEALQLLNKYEHKAKPVLLSSAEIFCMSPNQVNICQYIEGIVLNNARLQAMLLDNHPARIPLTRSQEKIIATLPEKILEKSEFQKSLFLCQQPIKDVFNVAIDAAEQTFNQHEAIFSAADYAWSTQGIYFSVKATLGYGGSLEFLGSTGVAVWTDLTNRYFIQHRLPFAANNPRTTSAIVRGTTEMLIRMLIAKPLPMPTLLGTFLPVVIVGTALYNTYNSLTSYPIVKTIDEIELEQAMLRFLDASKNL